MANQQSTPSTDLLSQVKTRASSGVASQQSRAADGLNTVASALRRAGDELRDTHTGIASYAEMAGSEIDQWSQRLREKSPGEYVTDIERFARRRPAAFVGGAVLLGVGLARFLKSTAPRRQPTSGPRPIGDAWPAGLEGVSATNPAGRGPGTITAGGRDRDDTPGLGVAP